MSSRRSHRALWRFDTIDRVTQYNYLRHETMHRYTGGGVPEHSAACPTPFPPPCCYKYRNSLNIKKEINKRGSFNTAANCCQQTGQKSKLLEGTKKNSEVLEGNKTSAIRQGNPKVLQTIKNTYKLLQQTIKAQKVLQATNQPTATPNTSPRDPACQHASSG